MAENAKNFIAFLVVGIISAVIAFGMFIFRFAVSLELKGIKSSQALIVQVGSKKLSRSQYIDLASSIINVCTVMAVIFLVIAVVFIALYIKKKNAQLINK